jgi:hypothetical protein
MILKFRHIFLPILIALLSYSFIGVERSVEPEEYLLSYQQMGTSVQKDVWSGKVHYFAGFLTKEIQVIHALQRGTMSKQEASTWLKKKENEVTILFQIEIPANGRQEFLKYEVDSSTYEERVKYYSFEFKNDITLSGNNSTELKISDYHFERDFGLSPKGTISLSVILPKNLKTLVLKFNDQIYGDGVNTIDFDLKEINALPKLKDPRKWKNLK